MTSDWPDTLRRPKLCALLVGISALGACGLGALWRPQRSLEAYLCAYVFWIGAPLGSMGFIMVHHLTGGRWGSAIDMPLRAAIRTIAFMAVLFLPLALCLDDLYVWARPHADPGAHDLGSKAAYLNKPMFLLRALGYFIVWIGIAVSLVRWVGQPRLCRRISAAGLILLVLTVTFASFDWAMSLDPHWYSSVYGLLFVVNHALVALSIAILLTAWLSARGTRGSSPSPEHLNDLGNLMLTLVSLWAYLSFSQFLITWSGNLAEEAAWYVVRGAGAWGTIAPALIVLHFAVPFVLLLNRPLKRGVRPLAAIAAFVLFMHVLDAWWILVPSFPRPQGGLAWQDPAAMIGLGGLWVAAWLWCLKPPGLQEEPSRV